MGFSTEIYELASAQLKQKRESELRAADERMEIYTAKRPEYHMLERELSQTGILLAKTIFQGGNGSQDISDIRERNLSIQRQMTDMLLCDGYPADYLEPHFDCKKCSDTGIENGRLCSCILRMMRQIAYDRLNAITPLSLSTFSSFSLSHYSDSVDCGRGLTQRRIMEIIFNKCRRYAESFSLSSPSLLFQGGVGLGKTHLSLAIAGEVINKGFEVVYGSSLTFFSKIESEHFAKNSTDETLSLLNSCELLIIDDLGAEFVTPFTVSMLYNIVNTRLLSSKPTIISTNLDLKGLEQKYSERLVSRIHGSYSCYQFTGKDMRITLRKVKCSGEADKK